MRHRNGRLKNGTEVELWWFDGGPFSLEMVNGDGAATWYQISPGEIGIVHDYGIHVVPKAEIQNYTGEEWNDVQTEDHR